MWAQQGDGTGDGAGFGLAEDAPIPIEISPRPIFPRVVIRTIGVDHRHDIENHRAQIIPQSGVSPVGNTMQQAEHRLSARRFIAVLAAKNKNANAVRAVNVGRIGGADEPESFMPLRGRSYGGEFQPCTLRRFRLELRRHPGIGRNRRTPPPPCSPLQAQLEGPILGEQERRVRQLS